MLVGLLLVTRGGSLLKHALGVLLLAWRRILLAGSAAAVAGILIGEIAAVIMTGKIPPPVMAHVVVVIFAFVLAYCTALSVFLEEILHGILNTVRLLEGDVAAGARAAAALAEREAGEAGSIVTRLFGGRQKPQPPAADATARAFVAPTVDSMRAIEERQTVADFDATQEFVTTSPRPRVDARPVRADQLPRIGWAASGPQSTPLSDPDDTYASPADSSPAMDGSGLGLTLPDAPPLAPSELDQEPTPPLQATPAPVQPATPAVAPTPVQPRPAVVVSLPAPSVSAQQAVPLATIPVRTPAPSQPMAPVVEAVEAPVVEPEVAEAAVEPQVIDAAPTSDSPLIEPADTEPLTEPTETAPLAETSPSAPQVGRQGEQWSPPSAVTVLPPEAAPEGAGDGYGEGARPTRPLSRPIRPLDSGPNVAEGRGIWSRISQALVGNTNAPTTPDTTAPGAPASDPSSPSA